MMRIEYRSDGLHISGYVNVTGKKSRPLTTPHGRCIEVIEERSFANALNRHGEVTLNVDHDKTNVYARTTDGTLELHEDSIGLHANVTIKDPALIEIARQGKIKGWSFGMYNVVDELEQRADELPVRHVKDFDIDHVTLVVNQTPCYSATSVEYRAEEPVEIEERGIDMEIEYIPDNSGFRKRLEALKKI